ncbi:aminotransferase class V-fold PLP-dependent enzyme [Melittangium boletus]|uniref:Penicillin epimerase n=1 Tax=Melittangium boletus DSM 14713 TaxID=1294270 RepID=A0A250I874_9BACT|nr:aminotransferase class V-fold PLP-dependent enzyme [Melittangium boletus]ATB27965.1 penicillin epimerase [Melittangium boletus DSM 14713]
MDSSPLRAHWSLDPDVTFLNHGSFGACPTRVLEEQSRLRARMEANPVRFLHRELPALADAARESLGNFLDANPDDLAFLPNATTGVNTVLRSLRFAPGDELLTTDHEYNASRNALDFVAQEWGVTVVVARLPWPLPSSQAVVDAVLSHVTERTRLLLVDHVTSQTGLVLPVASLVRALKTRGVETLVDGAHGPGQVPVSLRELGAAYYTGNCHKWMCSPKGAAFLYVRRDLQPGIRPLVISHGYNSRREDRSRFRLDFDWMGTNDPTPALCIPTALETVDRLIPGGWTEVMARNRAQALAARSLLHQKLGGAPRCPEDMVGSMATVALPNGFPEEPSALGLDPLQERLFDEHRIEVQITPWPRAPQRHVRISAQLYNSHAEYQRLAEALVALLR